MHGLNPWIIVPIICVIIVLAVIVLIVILRQKGLNDRISRIEYRKTGTWINWY